MKKQTPHDQFKDHKIRRNDAMSLLLKNPKSGNMWCTIAIDDHGQIAVLGDFGPIVFGCCPVPFEQRIDWLGSHEEVDDYVLQKAKNGMSDLNCAITVTTAETFESDARREFAVRLKALENSGDEGAFSTARERLTWERFQGDWDWVLGDHDFDDHGAPARWKLDGYLHTLGYEESWEWIADIGQRPIPAIGLAHAALRRAHLLLKADREYVERCARDS